MMGRFMPWHQIIEACCVVFLGSVLQGAVGFGIGMFSIPILVWIGLPLEATVAMMIVVSACQTAWCWFRSRDSMDWRLPIPMVGLRIVFAIPGVLVLGILSVSGQRTIKQVVGGIIIAILVTQWLFRIKPRQQLAAGWLWLAGSISGFLTGLISMGGSPLVMWVMAHDWPSRQSRAFLWLTFLMTAPFAVLLLWLRFGNDVLQPMGIGVLLTPFIVAGATVGMWIGGFMTRSHLRIAMTVLLTLIAATSIIAH
jgi:uncharacterized membrane protein YfcA